MVCSVSQATEAGGDETKEYEEGNETDDWEGVESTELEELFGAGSTYVASMVTLPGVKPSSEAMLQLYAYYKIATEGPCSTSQPSAFQPTARAKWYLPNQHEMFKETFQYLSISFGSEPEGSGRRGIQEISIDGSNKNKNTCHKLRSVVTCNLSTSCKGGYSCEYEVSVVKDCGYTHYGVESTWTLRGA